MYVYMYICVAGSAGDEETRGDPGQWGEGVITGYTHTYINICLSVLSIYLSIYISNCMFIYLALMTRKREAELVGGEKGL